MMIFVSGVHGVGKSFFCDMVMESLGYPTYSASDLITKRKKVGFSKDKLIPDIDINQDYLLSAVEDLNKKIPYYLLDGHFCLLNANGQVQRIPQSIFTSLNPDVIVLLTENVDVIIQRRKTRDDLLYSNKEIELFQDEEIAYAKEIATILKIPIFISPGADCTDVALKFIQTTMRRINDGR